MNFKNGVALLRVPRDLARHAACFLVKSQYRESVDRLPFMIELRGKKAVLRTMERQHCRTLWEHYELEEPIPTEPVRPGHSLEGSEKWFDEIQQQQGKSQIYLGIFDNDGNLVGDIQLSAIDWRSRTASLGFGIALRQDRGKGYCTDAALVMLRFGFEELDLYRISAATCNPDCENRYAQEAINLRQLLSDQSDSNSHIESRVRRILGLVGDVSPRTGWLTGLSVTGHRRCYSCQRGIDHFAAR